MTDPLPVPILSPDVPAQIISALNQVDSDYNAVSEALAAKAATALALTRGQQADTAAAATLSAAINQLNQDRVAFAALVNQQYAAPVP